MTFVDISRRVRHFRLLRRQQWLWRIARLPYRSVVRALSRVTGVRRVIGNETFRWRYPFSDFDQDFEEAVLEVFRELLRPGMTVIDVGANFGLYSVVAGSFVGEAGKVFAFEPSSVARVLADHLRLNGLAQRVEVVSVAVTDEVGEVTLWEPEDGAFASLSPVAAEHGAKEHTKMVSHRRPTTTIDVFCSSRDIAPDVIKIDVEGAEGKVLRGARHFLESRQGRIILELHPWTLEVLGESGESLLTYLDSLGWDTMELFVRGDPDDPARTTHYLCVPRAQLTEL